MRGCRLYCELYHLNAYPFVSFDPEFPQRDPEADGLRLRMRNLNNRLHFEFAEAGISPTQFQANTFPKEMLDRITINHDGIDTNAVDPQSGRQVAGQREQVLTRDDGVITFINRNLEPYRGYHVFMRALPKLLKSGQMRRLF